MIRNRYSSVRFSPTPFNLLRHSETKHSSAYRGGILHFTFDFLLFLRFCDFTFASFYEISGSIVISIHRSTFYLVLCICLDSMCYTFLILVEDMMRENAWTEADGLREMWLNELEKRDPEWGLDTCRGYVDWKTRDLMPGMALVLVLIFGDWFLNWNLDRQWKAW